MQIGDDLFDFDFEVDPILEVIIGKTLEQSMLEVMEEEEMERIRAAKEEFTNRRNAELADAQRLENQEKRRFEEKENRKKQERERLQAEHRAKERLACRAFAKTFLSNLEIKVFTELERQGHFHDVVERTVETQFIPYLKELVHSQLEKKRQVRNELVDGLIKKALLKMAQNKESSQQIQ